MAQITGGSVSVEDGLKKQEEYAPPRKVRVDLTFAVAEGEDFQSVFDLASEAASTRVSALLNGVSLRVINAGAAPAAEPEAQPQRRKRRTKAEIEADEAAKRAGSNAGEELPDDPTGGEEGVIHLPDESEELPDDEALEDETPAGDELDEFTVQPEKPKAEEVSDADLNAHVQRKNAELQNPDLIRKLIAEYNPDPTKVFQLREIPQAKRGEFLKKLAGLKKAG